MNKRIMAFLIDYLIVMFLFLALSFFSIHKSTQIIIKLIYSIFFVFSLISIIAKDIIKGQSFGKKIMKIKVVDLNNHQPSILKLILRNITIFIWPIEFLLVLLDKSKIGDRIAKTKIIDCF